VTAEEEEEYYQRFIELAVRISILHSRGHSMTGMTAPPLASSPWLLE